jgi:colicin import membrane protein
MPKVAADGNTQFRRTLALSPGSPWTLRVSPKLCARAGSNKRTRETTSTPLAELRESSLLFSLDSLLAHERNRVEAERAAAEERRLADEAKRAAEARQRAEAEARRLAAEREAAARAEALRREEEARLEAIRRAELEKAAAETRLRGEIELAARRSEHELRLSALKSSRETRALRSIVVATSAIAVLAASGALVVEFGVRRPERERMQASFAAELAGERRRSDGVRELLVESEKRARKLEESLHSPAPKAAPAPPPAVEPARPQRPVRPSARPVGRDGPPCQGNPHDPLNPCL